MARAVLALPASVGSKLEVVERATLRQALASSDGISGWTVTALQLGLLAAVVATVIKALVLPLRRIPTDTQLARFIEEKNPTLKDSLVSAVDAIKNARPEQLTFVHLLTKDVLAKTKNVRFSDQVNKRKFNTFGTYLHGSVLPKNPALADELIRLALERRYGAGIELEPLDDTAEMAAHRVRRHPAASQSLRMSLKRTMRLWMRRSR